MARGRTIIVGGGIGAATPFTVGGFTYVANSDPPSVASGNIRQNNAVSPPQVFIGDALGTNPVGSTVLGGAVINANVEDSVVIGSVSYTNPTIGPAGRNRALVLGVNGGITPTAQQLGVIALLRNTTLNTAASSENSIIILSNQSTTTLAGSFGGVVIGNGITPSATNTGGVTIGGSINLNSFGSGVVLGNSITQTGQTAILVGSSLSTAGTGSTPDNYLIGRNCSQGGSTGTRNLFFGYNLTANTNAANNIFIGGGWSAAGSSNGQICIGHGSVPFLPGSGWIVMGHARDGVSFTQRSLGLLLGGLDVDTTGNTGFDIRFTNANGSDVVAGNVVITAPRSTGNAASGRIDLSTGVPTASGTTLQTARVGAAVQATTTAENTDLLVYDVTGATLKRVSRGAADSGGVGFRLLRIPN